MTLSVTSTAFEPGARIPVRYTGEGEDVSPALAWGPVPAGAKEICILCEDPDAPRPQPWVHWLVAGIPAGATGMPEGATGMPEGGNPDVILGMTDFGDASWGGPMPPRGHGVHHYHFRVYALKRPSGLRPGFSKADLLDAIRGHVLAEGEVIGTYERP